MAEHQFMYTKFILCHCTTLCFVFIHLSQVTIWRIFFAFHISILCPSSAQRTAMISYKN